jgi:putative copper resistance protein D
MKRWPFFLSALLFAILSTVPIPHAQALTDSGHQNVTNETSVTDDLHGGHPNERGEGSFEGKAFSEFAHHFAGSLEVILGLAELGAALQYPLPYWTRFILPGALSMMGAFPLIWSDRDAWPLGSLSFVETVFGKDREVIEHKFYGMLTLTIALIEMLRRLGRVRHPAWAAPLVLLVLTGGLFLFVHSHGIHPDAEAAKIQFQHTLLGIVDVVAAFSKGMASWLPGASPQIRNRWNMAWGASFIVGGLLLLAYSE